MNSRCTSSSGIRVLHQVDDEVRHLIEERTFESERVVPLVDRAAHDLPQHVVASFIAGQNSVRDRKRRRTRMIGNHAHRAPSLVSGS